MGDRAWRSLIDQHERLCRRKLHRYRGRLVKTTGDGLLANVRRPGAGGPRRPSECILVICCLRSSGITLSSRSVRIVDGATQLTLTPCGPATLAASCVSRTSPALAAAYAVGAPMRSPLASRAAADASV